MHRRHRVAEIRRAVETRVREEIQTVQEVVERVRAALAAVALKARSDARQRRRNVVVPGSTQDPFAPRKPRKKTAQARSQSSRRAGGRTEDARRPRAST